MRILVLSDSHGAVEACRLAVEQSAPDQILHLGDCVRDAERLHALFPAIPLTGVPGNCDWADADNPERLIELGGVRILMMHGHTRGVKSSAMNACYARARVRGADSALRPYASPARRLGRHALGHEPRLHPRPAHLRRHHAGGREN